jgi:hypothetical protein
MFQSGEQIARANPGTNYTVVGDSESDICEIFAEVGDMAENCDFVVRGCQNRNVIDCVGAANIDEALATAEIQATMEATISERTAKVPGETRARRKSRSARVAKIGVRAREVTIRGAVRPGGRLPDVIRKSQGPPGSMTIWRGLRRMEAYADAFQAFEKAKLRWGVEKGP